MISGVISEASVDRVSITCRNSLNAPLQPTHTHVRLNPADRGVKFSAGSSPPMEALFRSLRLVSLEDQNERICNMSGCRRALLVV